METRNNDGQISTQSVKQPAMQHVSSNLRSIGQPHSVNRDSSNQIVFNSHNHRNLHARSHLEGYDKPVP